MATKYKNIPVKEETYAQAQVIAEINGFGERGLGKLVDRWVARELPDCGHEKRLVAVELYPAMTADLTIAVQSQRIGYYCPLCNRVYQPILPKEREEELLAEVNVTKDPYGQTAAEEAKPRRPRKIKMTTDQIITKEE